MSESLADVLSTLDPDLRGVIGLGGLPDPGGLDRDAGLSPLTVLDQMTLARGRVHEVTGGARLALAALIAGAAEAEGPVLWARPKWRPEGLCPQGLAQFMLDPGRVIVAQCPTAQDILWTMEEGLRAGCVSLVIGEFVEAPDLRQVRRLHLAAAEGVARNRQSGTAALAPLGVLCAQDRWESRVAGVETRWALHPLPPEDQYSKPRWRLDRQLARGLPPKDWLLTRLDRHAPGGGPRSPYW